MKTILELLPAPQRSDAVNVKNNQGKTVMDLLIEQECDYSILELLSESESSVRK